MTVRPAVPDTMKIELLFTRAPGVAGGQEDWYCMTIYAAHGATPNQARADADYAAIRGWATAYWRPITPNSIVLREIKAYGLHTVPPTKYTRDLVYPGTIIQGTLSTAPTPRQLAPVISLRTGAVGAYPKPPHGRLYHTGCVIDDLVSNTGYPSVPAKAAWVAAYTALKTAFTGVGNLGTWSIISYWSGGTRAAPVLRGSPLVLPVDHIKTPDALGTLRSRRSRQQSYLYN